MMSFVKSGEFTLKDKLRWALFDNLKYYAIIGIVGIMFLIYLWWNNTFERLTLRGFLIALSNVWGLF
jgi:LMBR1-like membrane protein